MILIMSQSINSSTEPLRAIRQALTEYKIGLESVYQRLLSLFNEYDTLIYREISKRQEELQDDIDRADGRRTDSFLCGKCGNRMMLLIRGDTTRCKCQGCDGIMHRVIMAEGSVQDRIARKRQALDEYQYHVRKYEETKDSLISYFRSLLSDSSSGHQRGILATGRLIDALNAYLSTNLDSTSGENGDTNLTVSDSERSPDRQKLSDQEVMAPYSRITGDHSVEDDLRETNPNYSHIDPSSPYNNNCQRCVSAYEARRRGYDVQAQPLPEGRDSLPIMMHPNGWPSVYAGFELINCSANSGTAAANNIESQMEQWGPNARAIVRVRWKPECGGGGHVFIAERIAGETRFIDPQNSEMDARYYFEDAKGTDVFCMRIDNLPFTDHIHQCCIERGKGGLTR